MDSYRKLLITSESLCGEWFRMVVDSVFQAMFENMSFEKCLLWVKFGCLGLGISDWSGIKLK